MLIVWGSFKDSSTVMITFYIISKRPHQKCKGISDTTVVLLPKKIKKKDLFSKNLLNTEAKVDMDKIKMMEQQIIRDWFILQNSDQKG